MVGRDDKELAEIVEDFLKGEKRIVGRLKWRDKGHPDYCEALKIVECPDFPEVNAELRMTGHKTRVPPKYSFTLLIGNVTILRLDVNPARRHYNRSTLESVTGTHWQAYPTYEAIVDECELSHREWFSRFCARANIVSEIGYKAPPLVPVQLSLL